MTSRRALASERTIVVGHGDDPALLERNIAHHLAIGFDTVIVATGFPDAAATAVVASFASDRVVAHSPDRSHEDPFRYNDSATRLARERFESTRIAYVDTDEFVVCRYGSIARTPASERYDLVLVPRYNLAPARLAGGELATYDLTRPIDLPIVESDREIEAPWLAGDTSIPYVAGKDIAGRIYARGRFVDSLVLGAHGIRTYAAYVTRAIDRDIGIVHLPFTTLERFARKVAAIRRIIHDFSDRIAANEMWHWRHWATLDDAGVRDEFEQQLRAAQLSASLQPRTTMREIFARDAVPSAPLDPQSWRLLRRAVGHFPRSYPHVPAPPWLAEIFDARWYAARYDDVRAAAEHDEIDATEHYLRYGLAEGRSPSDTYDAAFIRAQLEHRAEAEIDPRDVFWLYFDLAQADRPAPHRRATMAR